MFGVLREAIRSRDPVTGALCQSAFERAVFAWIGDGAGTRRPSSTLMLVRLDWDERGRTAHRPARRQATTMLRAVADATATCIRATDILGRVDDDTLGLLLPSTPAGEAQLVADRIRAAVAELPTARGEHITLSIGVATGLVPDPWAAAVEALDDASLSGGDAVVVARSPRLDHRRRA